MTSVILCESSGGCHGVDEGVAVLGVTAQKSEGTSLNMYTGPVVQLFLLGMHHNCCAVLIFHTEFQ